MLLPFPDKFHLHFQLAGEATVTVFVLRGTFGCILALFVANWQAAAGLQNVRTIRNPPNFSLSLSTLSLTSLTTVVRSDGRAAILCSASRHPALLLREAGTSLYFDIWAHEGAWVGEL